MAYTIEACRQCGHVDEVYVSSDDPEVLEVAVRLGAVALSRPSELADDATPKMVAIRQAVKDPIVVADGIPDIVLIPQANSPQITADQLNRGFELMLTHDLWEVMSADSNGVQNAAFRMVRYHALFNEFLSAHCGFVVAENMDVHTLEDLEKIPV